MNNRILAEIEAERIYQDEKWGGPEHDDQHEPNDWIAFITCWNGKAFNCCEKHPIDSRTFRFNMVKVAALAVAAMESVDRKEERR
ncbi:hypothetical protein LCGC14_0874060 [marine sediment metagenome]|uniref:dATP/dGTP diphosphohydrolase N-terminal domain-containing protein n=1 Tax=marine sediment metagenome TaxID=412755 RepID=A0A0F9P3U1_9ZZZZ